MADLAGTRRTSRNSWLVQQQLQEHLSQLTPAVAGNLINGFVAIALFWGKVDAAYLLGGYAVLAGLLGWRYRLSRTHAERSNQPGAAYSTAAQLNILALSLGGIWGLCVASLFTIATPGEQVVLAMLAAGMMSAGTSTFRTLPRAARLYLLGPVVFYFAAFSTLDGAIAYASIALLLSYTIFLTAQIKNAARRFNLRKLRERELAKSNETIALLLHDFTEQGSDWLIEIDEAGQLVAPSLRMAEACRRPLETLVAKPLLDLLDKGEDRDTLAKLLNRRRPFRAHIVSLSADGDQLWWSISARPAAEGGWRGVVSDITAQRHAEDKVSYMAHFDGLTDLPNRFFFTESLYHALLRENGVAGVMYLDLDNFKSVNDTLGHPVGDHLLQAVARRLEATVSRHEIVARLGGDEFAILVNANRLDQIDSLAERIVAQLCEPFALQDHDVVVGTSIGIAIAPEDATDADMLMRKADLALYSAKTGGRNRAMRFQPDMDEAAQSRRQIESDLRGALARGELHLHYQKLINLESAEASGYEALIRWEHPERGTVMPGEFIPVAEETGLIIPIGEWVLRQAVSDLAQWDEALTVSINLSPAQMRSPSLISTLANAIAQNDVDPARICLEITETVLMQDTDTNIEILHALRRLGVQIALDDFGTGYSSLNYLRSFPFDKIKIDRCFISEIDSREDCQAIVRSVVNLASSLGMTTTAEGVEREEQMEHLRAQGCDEVQGFLFSHAVALNELTDLRSPSRLRSPPPVATLERPVAPAKAPARRKRA